MPAKGKWENDDLWQQAERWLRGGLTYSEIAGRLARDEYRRRFGLEAVPSEDTVRKRLKRWVAQQRPKAQQETGIAPGWATRHLEELLAFGIRFRNRLAIPNPADGAAWEDRGPDLCMWRGERIDVTDLGEARFPILPDREWPSVVRYDARTHSLFGSFSAHVAEIVHALGELEARFRDYIRACREARLKIEAGLVELAPQLEQEHIDRAVGALLLGVPPPHGTEPSFVLTCDLVRTSDGAESWWSVQLTPGLGVALSANMR